MLVVVASPQVMGKVMSEERFPPVELIVHTVTSPASKWEKFSTFLNSVNYDSPPPGPGCQPALELNKKTDG